MATQFIKDKDHYEKVLTRIDKVKDSVWIGTADIKDLYLKKGTATVPLLAVLAGLLSKGKEVRLIHAKEPGPVFREEFDRYPILARSLERALCPRVHFKIIILDYKTAYIGSANLTGAGIGMKGENTRNFEAGILTDEPQLVKQAMELFDTVWTGIRCKGCGRREFCGDPIR